MGKLAETIEEMREKATKGERQYYYLYFTHYFNILNHPYWKLSAKQNGRYYLLYDDSKSNFSAWSARVIQLLSTIDNNKSLALLNIRNNLDSWFIDAYISQVLQGNELYLEKVE
jgi:hypothetical protein